MTYELANELKDAGYNFRYITDEEPTPFLEHLTWMWHIPTLSELIEACGDSFESLDRIPNGQLVDEKTGESIGVYWYAYPTEEAYTGDCVVDCCGYESGATPEEAVAKLWLELNKK